jgi:tRNA (guanine37-N1)-methyltransferase
MDVDVFTLFPDAFGWFLGQRHVRNSMELGSTVSLVDPRESTTLSGRSVDDTPFGGGAGMVLRVDVMDAALEDRYGVEGARVQESRRVVALTPSGRMLDEALAVELAAEPALTLLCGRYEGFDERIVEHFCTDTVSIGPYVLAGGELPAMVLLDAVMRKLPGALGHAASAEEESFSAALEGLPEYPHYTRPASYKGWDVPEVLLSGHHARVAQWRLEQSRERGSRAPRYSSPPPS